ncbi:hypothetical protein [Amycolatopsis sp. CA-126428]|uniref:hypothetical protein n=1 Tax=Amycolatopsis sp. CA-126428 TaxID=2073158 RepID=UPI001E4636E0|nr:hypothetical protein [Amycolatopsis sp. CA-126428]
MTLAMSFCRDPAYGPASAKSRSSTPTLLTNSVATAEEVDLHRRANRRDGLLLDRAEVAGAGVAGAAGVAQRRDRAKAPPGRRTAALLGRIVDAEA